MCICKTRSPCAHKTIYALACQKDKWRAHMRYRRASCANNGFAVCSFLPYFSVLPCSLQYNSQESSFSDSKVDHSDGDGHSDADTDGCGYRAFHVHEQELHWWFPFFSSPSYFYFFQYLLAPFSRLLFFEISSERAAERGLLSKTSGTTKFIQSIKSRLAVAQVVEGVISIMIHFIFYEFLFKKKNVYTIYSHCYFLFMVKGVRESAVLSFDFIMFVLLAGYVCVFMLWHYF